MIKMTRLGAVIRRQLHQLCSRRLYIAAMIAVPVFMAVFFISLLDSGLPIRVPVAVVDLDNSVMSREVIRNLDAMETVDICIKATGYDHAVNLVNSGEVYGFFLIPEDFESDAIAQRSPTLSYYANMTYYIPGTLAYKGFKTIAVSTSGALVRTTLVSAGADSRQVGTLLQPVVVQDHPIHNPWSNYSVYLSNSFLPGVIALMVLLVTVYSVGSEIKNGTSAEWLETARQSLTVAIIGKMLPQTLIFSVVGVFVQSLLWGYNHFPLHCNIFTIIAAMVLLVIACQSFALIVCSILPNLRLALSVVSLLGVLSFSVTGFSFPVESMYGSIGIFSYLLPLRYYFLIYVDQALNGVDLYYSRMYFAALLIFPLVVPLVAWRLRRVLSNPVYIP